MPMFPKDSDGADHDGVLARERYFAHEQADASNSEQ